MSGLVAVAVNPVTASAQVGTHRQSVPSAGWGAPMPVEPPEYPFGIGQWVYVAPMQPAGADQLPTTGYVYGPTFIPQGSAGVIGLSSDAEGPIAGIKMANSPNPSLATIRYDWSPGKFYFLLAYHLGNGLWAGWVYDNAASVWTPIGAVQAPTAGLLSNLSVNNVYGAKGAPTTAFGQDGPDIEQPCSAFPRVDAYFYPPVFFWQSTFAASTLAGGYTFSQGDCLTEATTEFDWAHIRLGSPAGT